MSQQAIGTLLDDTARDELAVKHLDLVAQVVGRLPITIPHTLSRDDLLSAGSLGLLKAARTFQPMRGASFRTFAYMAIRAAVLDELRRNDPLPRGARGRLRALRELETEFLGREGRLPTPGEIAAGLELSLGEAEQLLTQEEEQRLLRTGEARSPTQSFDPVDLSAVEPCDNAARQEDLRLVEAGIRALSLRERQVVVLYFSEGLYLREIGEVMGVTESRICQILACAQRRIRAHVEKLRKEHHG